VKLHLFVLALSILTVALAGIFHVKVNKTEDDLAAVVEDVTKIDDIDQKLDAIEEMMEREKDGLDHFLN
jgi:hypothetical protein